MTEYYKKFIESYPIYGNDPLIEKAFDVAEKAHVGQQRASGEPYIIHPYEVVRILAELGLDSISICAGMLHDVPEDTEYTLEQIEKEFNPEIARIVDGVTKLTRFGFQSKEEAQAESLRKMFLAMASDIRVIIIKLADRLHNMRTLDYKNEEKRREKSKETLEIYAPLAHRLGINTFKWEFEDLSLKYLEPQAYFDIAAKLNSTRAERENYIAGIIATLKEKLAPLGIKTEIEGRPKHIYSIYKKMKTKAKTFEELYDLVAVRIIVETVKDCYGVLGAVHTIWRPLPMRFKDYIAVPKQNMYQSLHTTLLGTDGKPFEVQIRTFEMHKTAEYGIAAHWKYKDGTTGQTDLDQKLAWLRELMEWQNDMKDSREFMEALKINFFSDNVFVFTPKGDVKDLVKGSTPLDFAYSIHSQIGHKCVGAKVNGRIVPLNYELKTGDIVEVMTNPNSKGPSRDWLSMVKTAAARSKIRAWFKKELKEENIHKGREALEQGAKRLGYELHTLLKPEWLKGIYKKYTLNNIDDMYAAVGYGGLAASQILSRLIELYRKENHISDAVVVKQPPKGNKSIGHDAVIVRGQPDMVVRLAKCCNPLPGDEIIGYVTRGRGVSVHRADCSNINDVDFEPARRIEVAWGSEETAKYMVEIQINGHDTPGLLAEISQLMFSLGYSIAAINARSMKNKDYCINLKFEVAAIRDLQALMEKIHRIPSVTEVFRVNN